MFQFSNRFNIYILMFTNEICPNKSHADHCDKSFDAFHVAHMDVLDVESGSLHGSECGLNLPAFFIGENCTFRSIKADKDLQFRNTIEVFNPTTCKIDVFSFMEEQLMVELFLADLQVIEKNKAGFDR